MAFADNDFSDVQTTDGDLFFVENEASPHGHWKRMKKDDQPRESRDLGVPHFWIPDSCRKEQLRSRSFKPVFHRQMRDFIRIPNVQTTRPTSGV